MFDYEVNATGCEGQPLHFLVLSVPDKSAASVKARDMADEIIEIHSIECLGPSLSRKTMRSYRRMNSPKTSRRVRKALRTKLNKA